MPSICRYLWPITNHILLCFAPSACQLDALPRLATAWNRLACPTAHDYSRLRSPPMISIPSHAFSAWEAWKSSAAWTLYIPKQAYTTYALDMPVNRYRTDTWISKRYGAYRNKGDFANRCWHSSTERSTRHPHCVQSSIYTNGIPVVRMFCLLLHSW